MDIIDDGVTRLQKNRIKRSLKFHFDYVWSVCKRELESQRITHVSKLLLIIYIFK